MGKSDGKFVDHLASLNVQRHTHISQANEVFYLSYNKNIFTLLTL